MYKQASQLKLRFQTSSGNLLVEQLWDLTMPQLSSAIKSVKKILAKDSDDELSFLTEEIKLDIENQLRFDILKDVYLSKKKEIESKRDDAVKKEHNQHILALIAAKQTEELQGKSIAELQALLQ